MYSIRIISLAAVLLGSLLVNAAPLPAVSAHHVKPGSVFTAKPAHFNPPLPGHTSTQGSSSGHPVVALGHPDREGWVPVASVSHNQPSHMGTTHDASRYDAHTRAAGTGGFNSGSRVAVAAPTHVHISNLNHIHPESNLPHQLHDKDTTKIVDAVHQASGFRSNNPRIVTPPPTTPPWRKGRN